MTMKKVLWVSRHPLSREQKEGLTNFCGETPEIVWYQDTVEAPEELIGISREVDVLAVVLPLHLLPVAVETGKTVLISRAERVVVPKTDGRTEVRFTHGGWLRINRLELDLVPTEL